MLQKLSYVGVIFVALPLIVATGLAISPGMDAAWPWLLDVFGGRQSARSIHFLCMAAISLFVVVHLVLVILAGVGNELRSMITGKWRVPHEPTRQEWSRRNERDDETADAADAWSADRRGGAAASRMRPGRADPGGAQDPVRGATTSTRGCSARCRTGGALAPEYRPDQMSPVFRSNGTFDPGTPAYAALVQGNFADYRLNVGGLVDRPLSLEPGATRFTMPQRSQITRHDCVEGWSAIGQWQGPMLGTVLKAAGMRRSARYVVFTCADLYDGQPYYESIDTVDALPSADDPRHANERGAAGRSRTVRPSACASNASWATSMPNTSCSINAVASLDGIGQGKGGYWEDSIDYDWYAGI